MAVNPSEYFGCKVFSQKIMQEKKEERTKKLAREEQKRQANIKLKKKRSYALKGAAEKRRSQ